MTQLSFQKGIATLSLLFSFSIISVNAQTVEASPQNLIRPVAPNTTTISLDRLNGGWGGSGTYVWTVSPTTGVTIGSYSQTNPNAGDATATFSGAAVGAYTFTLTRGAVSASVTVQVGNLAATSSSGTRVSSFLVNNGVSLSGPGNVFTPSVTTAALGLSASGFYYYLPNTFNGNDGNVTVYAANPNGTGNTPIGSIDLNGASNSDLGFVRLAIDAAGVGWILAGDNTQLYLGRFTANGTNATSITSVDPSVTVVNGQVSTFFNGDICFSGTGSLYALANSSSGVTQIFTGTPNGANTTLTKKWDLRDPNGNAFSGSVNGVAFDAQGSLYISTSTGLYFIDQQTVNTATGTVQCALVTAVSGLTDLASNLYPQQSTLPVELVSFSGVYRNGITRLNWETAGERNFDRFSIERAKDGGSFSAIGEKPATGANRQQYEFSDDLTAAGRGVYTYRLKLIDQDGQFKYSQVILVRAETKTITGITLSPSPVTNGMATVRFTADRNSQANVQVLDLTGKKVLGQNIKVYEGTNSVSLDNLGRLPSGTYVLHLAYDQESSVLKFVIK